jgi:hypothetical protein
MEAKEPEPMTYIARKDCGCIVFAGVDTPEMRKENAKEVASCIRDGYTIERVTCQFVRETDWFCPKHRAEHDKKEVMDRMQGRML